MGVTWPDELAVEACSGGVHVSDASENISKRDARRIFEFFEDAVSD